GLRASSILLLRIHSLTTKGPAPTGELGNVAPALAAAVGETIQFSPPNELTSCGNCAFFCCKSKLSVRSSGAIMLVICWATWRVPEPSCGSVSRVQLNCTAAALKGVPSLNVTFGRRANVQCVPSSLLRLVASS